MVGYEQMTNQDANRFITGLCLYFMQEDNEGSPISAPETALISYSCSQLREHGRVHLISSSVIN
jgi:hypothetical protein